MKKIYCKGAGDNDGFFECTPEHKASLSMCSHSVNCGINECLHHKKHLHDDVKCKSGWCDQLDKVVECKILDQP